jgi:hypothetical protein
LEDDLPPGDECNDREKIISSHYDNEDDIGLLTGDFSSTVIYHGLPSSLAFRADFRYADSRRFNP